MSTYDGHITVM